MYNNRTETNLVYEHFHWLPLFASAVIVSMGHCITCAPIGVNLKLATPWERG